MHKWEIGFFPSILVGKMALITGFGLWKIYITCALHRILAPITDLDTISILKHDSSQASLKFSPGGKKKKKEILANLPSDSFCNKHLVELNSE